MSITLFAIPKPFRGHFDIIQRNAIRSWTLLHPACEIILFGDDEGCAEVAAEFGLRHVPGVARNEYGTPLLNNLFEQAQRIAPHNVLCYVNADIILMSDFMRAVEQVVQRKKHFLMVGQRWDMDIQTPLEFGPAWEDQLHFEVRSHGTLHNVQGIDYFLFSRGLFGHIPSFLIGRTAWDNWLLYRACERGAPLIDVTQIVMAVHQNHDYSHHPQGEAGVYQGVEAQHNVRLAEGRKLLFISDATHLLMPDGLKLAFIPWYAQQHMHTLPVFDPSMLWTSRMIRWFSRLPLFYPYLTFPVTLLLNIVDKSRSFRTRIGFTLSAWITRNQ